MVENRRKLLILGGAALAGYAVLQRLPSRGGPVAFTDHPRVPGFRTLATEGQVSASAGATQAVLLGLTAEPPLPEDVLAEVTADPQTALFGGAPAPGLAYFTDIRCPICRPYEATLARLRDENPDLVQVTHEFPVFGESSVLAARALIAAGPELAADMRPRLQRSAAVMSETYLGHVIADLGADPAPILGALHGQATDRVLNRSRALARLFGLRGTPATVLGRTVLIGAQPLSLLRALLEAERSGPGD